MKGVHSESSNFQEVGSIGVFHSHEWRVERITLWKHGMVLNLERMFLMTPPQVHQSLFSVRDACGSCQFFYMGIEDLTDCFGLKQSHLGNLAPLIFMSFSPIVCLHPSKSAGDILLNSTC